MIPINLAHLTYAEEYGVEYSGWEIYPIIRCGYYPHLVANNRYSVFTVQLGDLIK